MAGVINNSARQIDLRKRAKLPNGHSGIVRITLNPGFNVVDNEKWDIVCQSPHTKVLLSMNTIVGNAKITREDELIAQKIKDDQNRELHELSKTDRAASLVKGDTIDKVHVATASSSLSDGSDSTSGTDLDDFDLE